MIDEKKLIEEIQDHIEKERTKCNQMVDLGLGDLFVKYNHGEYCYVNALHLVQIQPKVGEWIPCSERLPEEETLLYWTTHEDGSLVLHGYKKSNGFIYNWEVDDLEKRKRQGQVIAWIPIFEPAPYNADMRKKVE